jgi:hypothetical protein
MKGVIFLTIAFFCAHALCQELEENLESQSTKTRSSMLSMLSKYIEMNGTIDEVMKGSLTATESYGGVWLNATQRPSGMCEIEETYEEEVTITDRIPYQVEVEVWCWSIRCTEWETHYREEKRKQNVTKTRLVCDMRLCNGKRFELVAAPPTRHFSNLQNKTDNETKSQ